MTISDLWSARLAFGAAAELHYIFVPLSLGLGLLLAAEDGAGALRALTTGQTHRMRLALSPKEHLAELLHRLFLICFWLGVVTGLPLRMLLAEHWRMIGEAAPNLFGAVFEFERLWGPLLFASVAAGCFRRRYSPFMRGVLSLWTAGALILQSVTVTALNAFLESPYGARMEAGRLISGGVHALIRNPMLPPKLAHILCGAMLAGGAFAAFAAALVMRRTALPLMKDEASGVFKRAAILMAAAAAGALWTGHLSGMRVLQTQPKKFAAMEGLWHPPAPPAPFLVAAWPDQAEQRHRFAFEIPGLLGFITGDDIAPLPGLAPEPHSADSPLPPQDPPQDKGDIPFVGAVFWAFRIMMGCWLFLTLWSYAVLLVKQERHQLVLQRLTPVALVAALTAGAGGWATCEMGRQPWIFTGLWRVSVAFTPAPSPFGPMMAAAFALVVLSLFLLTTRHSIRLAIAGREFPLPARMRDWLHGKPLTPTAARAGGGAKRPSAVSQAKRVSSSGSMPPKPGPLKPPSSSAPSPKRRPPSKRGKS